MTSGFWQKRAVNQQEWQLENDRYGSVYFAKDDQKDMVKIGHSFTPFDRIKTLQIGSAGRLRLIGVMAAPRSFETTLHRAFDEGRAHGEWFYDRDMVSLFLHDVTDGAPFCTTAWTLVPVGPSFWAEWDEDTKTHWVSRFDPGTGKWELVSR